MTYSLDFRKKVLELKAAKNMSYEECSKFFGLSKTTILKWKKNPIAKSKRNKSATKIDMVKLASDVDKYPDSYHYERARRMGVSTRGIGYALILLNVTYKKNSESPKGQQRRKTLLPKED